MHDLSAGVVNRALGTIRIPRHASEKGYGCMEVRRPASNAGKLISGRKSDVLCVGSPISLSTRKPLLKKEMIFVEPVF